MPCVRVANGILCLPNEPVVIEYGGKTYRFEWTGGCGWIPINLDGSERMSFVPRGAWGKLLLGKKAEIGKEKP